MRYGFCTGFATDPLFSINETLEAAVSAWGFDYIEYPLMSIAALPEAEFEALCTRVKNSGLSCDCMCNLFPASVPVIGNAVSEEKIRAYLEAALPRAKRLGVKKLIFGSAGARRLGDTPKALADRQFLSCLQLLDEYCKSYEMQVLIEAIRRGEADYINTLEEAAKAALTAAEHGCRSIALMADLFHMCSNSEALSVLGENIALIRHIHLCEAQRALPQQSLSSYLREACALLKKAGYAGTVSYESLMPASAAAGREACELLKNSI